MSMSRKATLRRGAGALVLMAVLLADSALAREPAPTSQASLIRGLLPSVVNITVRTGATETPDQTMVSDSQAAAPYKVAVGSGFVVDQAGLIATNWHVLTDAFEIMVTLSDGARVPATVVGAWRSVDLALLKVDTGHPLQAVRWGDSNAVQIGDPVLAMGNAFGVGLSVSAGIVSALNRNIGDSLVDEFIQTDAAINHGNSGGPLFNLQGEVIGVNSAIISPTAANSGLGFAIPSDEAQYVFQRMMNLSGSERPAWLGATVQGLTREMAEAMGAPSLSGALVAWVLPGQAAQKAGMIAGDVILRFDGKTFPDERALLRASTMRKPGEQVPISVWRDGKQLELIATLEVWPATIWERNTATQLPKIRLTVPDDLGLTVAEMTDALREANGIAADASGVLITGVAPGSDAAQQSMATGDVLLQVGPEHVQTPEALWGKVDRARKEGRKFGLFMVLPKAKPVDFSQFSGPKWVALRIAAE